tara:strand:+ start:103 stop:2529 length:2427 start_codon:yes stop_codon:yes gene_type:complete
MNYDEYGWRKFLTEARNPAKKPKMYTESKLLRELTEDEFAIIEDAIDSMEPEDMAFNELFEGKTRLVIDFKAFDETSDLGKFAKTLQDQGYKVDWEKGMVFAEREVSKGSSTDDIMAAITGARPEKRKKKIQMKIGKLFGKIADVARRQDELLAIIQKKADRTLRHPGNVTGNEAADALNAEQLENWERLSKQMTMYIPAPGLLQSGHTYEVAQKMANFWKDNAEYIKKNMDKLYSDRYSIIITRDPVDILRMSDFQRITSCHSPPSREQSTEGYFKCAVAEAHGHGAVAYVVNTEDLLHATNTSNIDSAEQEIQEGEIFADDMRGSWVGLSDSLVPLSRVRLRQVRVNSGDPPNMVDHQLAVPETRVYGSKIPGFQKRVAEWAKESQASVISKVGPDDNWIKYGGSYEDNNIKGLIYDLTGIELERVGKNTETEDTLPEMDFLESTMAAEQERCNELADDWTYRYQACQIRGEVTYDGGEGYYVEIDAKMHIRWEADEWNSLPDSRRIVEYWADELRDMQWGFMDDTSWGTRLHRDGDGIILSMQLDNEYLTEETAGGGGGYAFNADDFEDVCIKVNEIDDLYEGVKGELTRMAKRDGYMDGGALNNFGSEVDNGEFSAYEWDVRTEEESHMEYYSVEATAYAYPDYPDNMSPEDVKTILMSREFSVPLRKALTQHAWNEEGTPGDDRHYPNMTTRVSQIGTGDTPTIRLYMELEVNDNSSEEQVEAMKLTIEHNDDEEELEARVQAVFNQVVGEHVQTTDDRTKDLPNANNYKKVPDAFKDANRDEYGREVTNESIVRNWKKFLYS